MGEDSRRIGSMPMISLIIPVYKVEKYLPQCLDSVMAQSYADFECILVDDGSPDGSGAICDAYALKDARFRVIHKENCGVSAARNTGLAAAQGRYIAFSDSDDELHEDYLKALCEASEFFDMVTAGAQIIHGNGTVQYGLPAYDEEVLEMDREAVLNCIDRKALNSVCNKRYKRSLLEANDIRFEEGLSLAEDTLFNANYICHCKSLRYLPNYYYTYYRYEDVKKQTLSTFHADYVEKLSVANRKICEVLKACVSDIEESEVWRKRIFGVYYAGIWDTLRGGYSYRETCKMLRRMMKQSEYIDFCGSLETYMQSDGFLWKRLFAWRIPCLLVLAYRLLIKTKNKTKSE